MTVGRLILVVLKDAARDVLVRIMDGVEPAISGRSEAVLAQVAGVEGVGTVRIRWIGHGLHAEAEIVVDEAMSVGQAHDMPNERATRSCTRCPT